MCSVQALRIYKVANGVASLFKNMYCTRKDFFKFNFPVLVFSKCDQQLRAQLQHTNAAAHDLQGRFSPRQHDDGHHSPGWVLFILWNIYLRQVTN